MPHQSVHDAELFYEASGGGPTILFVQGVGCVGSAWSPQVEALSVAHRCVTFDNRGVGQSGGDTHALSVDVMARDALGLLDALGCRRAHLVGHSLGGVIVQRMALLAPERVASLSFMCTFAGGHDLRKPSARLMWLGALSRLGTRAMRRRAFARLIMPDAELARQGEAGLEKLERIFGRSLADAPAVADLQLRALREHDQRGQLGALADIPSIVLSGRLDPIATHAANAALAAALGTATHQVWDDASHALPIQHADAINQALVAHIARAEQSPARAACRAW
jgi:3-oxoadipate enol-lactonase